MKHKNAREMSFEDAEREFKKVVGLPIKKVWRSIGTWLWIDLGKMHRWRMKNDKRGTLYEGEEGDFTLEFEGRWVYKRGDTTILDPQLIIESMEFGDAGDLLDKKIEELSLSTILDVIFDDERESITFEFDDQSTIIAMVDGVGLVNLHNHLESHTLYFDVARGQFFIEENPAPSKGRQG